MFSVTVTWSFSSEFLGARFHFCDAAGQSFPICNFSNFSFQNTPNFPFSPSFFSAADQWTEEWKGKLKPKKNIEGKCKTRKVKGKAEP